MVRYMSDNILFCSGEGIGNVIQTIPVIRTLKEVLNVDIDFWYAFGSFGIPKIIPYVDNWISAGQIMNTDLSKYDGMVSTWWTRNHITRLPLKLLNKLKPLKMDRSEVDTYMDIARDLGVSESDIIWHGNCSYFPSRKKFDIAIHNGFNYKGAADWRIKSYPYYSQVVKLLIEEGYSVCSLGNKNEYIKGTTDKTELGLLESLGIIKSSKLFLGNDSGLYHCANALEVNNVVIFTATSIEKNYDKRFHKYSALIYREDLGCRPCQANRRWAKDCKSWECRNIDPNIIVEIVRNKICSNI